MKKLLLLRGGSCPHDVVYLSSSKGFCLFSFIQSCFAVRKNLQLFILVPVLFMMSVSSAFSQTVAVKGKITDGKEALPGVNVMVKGTHQAVLSNSNGEFTIVVPANAILVLSYTGFGEKEVPVNGRTFITETLQAKSTQMSDVIVVGYGAQRKLTSTGSFGQVTGDNLIKAPVAGVSNALIGMVAGVQAIQQSGEFGNDKADIHIRGIATLNANGRSPLILVDGVERDTYNNIDAHEIESISILKDASATAVFGVRGANGVIIITTKQGKIGKPRFGFTANSAMLQPSILPKMLGSYDYAVLRNEASRNSGKPVVFSDEDIRLYKTGEDPIFHSSTDWFDELIKPFSYQQSYNMNTSGGTEKLRYYTSLSYFNQSGGYQKPQQNLGFPFKHSYNRYNIRSNFDFNFTKDFSMSVKLGEQITDNSFPNGGAWGAFDKAMKSSPMSGPTFVDGKYIENVIGLPDGVPFFNPWGQAGGTSASGAFVNTQFGNVINTNLSLKYKLDWLTPGLSINAMGAYDSYYLRRGYRAKYFPAWTIRKDPNDPTKYVMYQTKDDGPWYGLSDGIDDNNNLNDKWRKIYAQASIEYNRTFHSAHHVTGLILGNAQKAWYTNLVPRLPTALLGLVSRVTYDYKGRYLGEVNMGYNGSENFPESKRYGFFPSFSLGWNITEEPWFPKTEVLSFAKLRGSYGVVGNDKIAGKRYLYMPNPYTLWSGGYQQAVFGTAGVDMARYNEYAEGAPYNPDVTWERAKKWNVGGDLQFFHNRLTITGDYFEEKRDNILWNLTTYPEMVVVTPPPANIGKVQNHGYELEVGFKDRIDKLSYYMKASYSFARNKIIFMDEATKPYPWMQRTGQPIDQYFGLHYEGLYNTQDEVNDPKRPVSEFSANIYPGDMKYKDLNEDGRLNSNDASPVGYSNWPEITYSLSFGGSWKNFDLSVLLQGTDHVSVYYAAAAAYPFANDWGPAYTWNLERWNPERYANGEKISYPRLELAPGAGHNYQVSDFWVQSGAYLRVKNVELGYTFTPALVKRAGLNGLRIYLSGNNLLTFTSMKYRVDPDAREQWGRVYPSMRVYNAGINLDF